MVTSEQIKTERELLTLQNVAAFVSGDANWSDLPVDVQNKLYEFYEPSMPHDTAKARTGDPDQWIADHLATLAEKFVR